MKTKENIIKEVLFTIILWIVILAGINGICGWIAQDRYIALDPVSPALSREVWGFFAPNQKKTILFPGMKPYHVKTNRLGFRSVGAFDDGTLTSLAGYKKILAVGDSVTFGLFVDDQDSYPFRLQSLWKAHNQPVVVFNAGIGSTTISDDFYYLREKGIALKPDYVVINFCDNDLVELSQWKTPMYQKMLNDSDLSLGERFKMAHIVRVFRGWELSRRYHRMINKNKDPKVRSILLSKSKNLDDIFYVTHDAYNPVLEDPRSNELTPAWQKYFEWLDQTAKLLNNEHIPFVVVIHPHIYSVFNQGKAQYQEVLIEHFKQKGIAYIDLKPVFEKHKDEIVSLYNDLPRDFHLSGAGNQLMAEEIYQFINKQYKI